MNERRLDGSVLALVLALLIMSMLPLYHAILESARKEELQSIHEILVETVGEAIYPIPELHKETGHLTNFLKITRDYFVLQGTMGTFLYDGERLERFEGGVILGCLGDQLIYWRASDEKLVARTKGGSLSFTAKYEDFDPFRYTRALTTYTTYSNGDRVASSIILFSIYDWREVEFSCMMQYRKPMLYIQDVHPRYVLTIAKATTGRRIELFTEESGTTHGAMPDILRIRMG